MSYLIIYTIVFEFWHSPAVLGETKYLASVIPIYANCDRLLKLAVSRLLYVTTWVAFLHVRVCRSEWQCVFAFPFRHTLPENRGLLCCLMYNTDTYDWIPALFSFPVLAATSWVLIWYKSYFKRKKHIYILSFL